MISVRMLEDWKYLLDETGNSERRIPKGLVLELEDDVAACALALGVAQPMRALSEMQQAMVDAAGAVLAGADPAEVEAALEEQQLSTIEQAVLDASTAAVVATAAAQSEQNAEPDSSQPDQDATVVAAEPAQRPAETTDLTYDPPRAEPEPDPEVATRGNTRRRRAAP